MVFDKKEYMKKWYNENKEKKKKYYNENKERLKEYRKTEYGKKIIKILKWKINGLKWNTIEEIDKIYERWLISKKCEKCDCEYSESNVRCMDHDHNTGLFRNILCHRCNVKTDRQTPNNNTSGYMNIKKVKNRWVYVKTINKKRFRKSFKTIEEAIAFKEEYESNL